MSTENYRTGATCLSVLPAVADPPASASVGVRAPHRSRNTPSRHAGRILMFGLSARGTWVRKAAPAFLALGFVASALNLQPQPAQALILGAIRGRVGRSRSAGARTL